MERRNRMALFMLSLFIHLSLFATSFSITKALLPDSTQVHDPRATCNSDCNDRKWIARNVKHAHGGDNGGGSEAGVQNGNGGDTRQGGSAVVPVIIAGAANNNRHPYRHRNAASCRTGLVTLVMTSSMSLFMHVL